MILSPDFGGEGADFGGGGSAGIGAFLLPAIIVEFIVLYAICSYYQEMGRGDA
jgi:hypothetical protein